MDTGVAKPTIVGDSDTDTGFGWDGFNRVKFHAGASEILQFTSTLLGPVSGASVYLAGLATKFVAGYFNGGIRIGTDTSSDSNLVFVSSSGIDFGDSTTGAGGVKQFLGQDALASSGLAGGDIRINGGVGDGAGADGNIVIGFSDTTEMRSYVPLTMYGISSADLTWNTDGAGDIGASGANRPDNVYAKTSVVAGGTVTMTTDTVSGSGALTVKAGVDSTFTLGNSSAATGVGGTLNIVAPQGAATSAGGPINITTGAGGATSGNSGALSLNAGSVTSGTAGVISIGSASGSAINLGNATDNTTITQTGSGQVTFSGNVDTSSGLDVSGANLTLGAGVDFEPSTTSNITMPTVLTTDTEGFFTLTQIAGTPAGAASNGSLAYDSSNNLVYARIGGSWTALSTGSPTADTLSEVLAAGNTSGSNHAIWADDYGIKLGTGSDGFLVFDNATSGDVMLVGGGSLTGSDPTPSATPAGVTVIGGFGTAGVAGADATMKAGDGGTDNDGGAANIEGGAGGDYSASASGVGGNVGITGGVGGSSGSTVGGVGGNVSVTAGAGGNGTTGGAGGSLTLDAGAAGTGGSPSDGSITIGGTTAAAINLGNATDNTTITQTGSGQVTFSGNVDATAGLDVTGAALTVANQAITQTTGGQVTFAGNVDAGAGLDVSGGALTVANQAITQTTGGQVTFAGNVDATSGLDVSGANLTVATGLALSMVGTADILWATDGGGDIGASGATRPDRVYAKTEVVVGDTVTIGSNSITGSRRERTELAITTAESGGNYTGTWWDFYVSNGAGGETQYSVYYYIGADPGTPGGAGGTGIGVAIVAADTAATIAGNTRTAITGTTDVTVSGSGQYVVLTNDNDGDVTDANNAGAIPSPIFHIGSVGNATVGTAGSPFGNIYISDEQALYCGDDQDLKIWMDQLYPTAFGDPPWDTIPTAVIQGVNEHTVPAGITIGTSVIMVGADASTSGTIGGFAGAVGGTGSGSGNGGTAFLNGGDGGATGNGAEASIAGGAGGSTSGNGGNVSMTGGSADSGGTGDGGAATLAGGSGYGTGNGGGVTIRGGLAGGSGTAGAVSIATSNTSAVTIGNSALTVTVNGTLAATNGVTLTTAGLTMTGLDIGSSSAEIGDVYLADDKSIWLGNAQKAQLVYDASASILGTAASFFHGADGTGGGTGNIVGLVGGDGDGAGDGGAAVAYAGDGGATGGGGSIVLWAGDGGATSGNGGDVQILGGTVTSGTPGNVVLQAGNYSSGTAGDTKIRGGSGSTNGKVLLGDSTTSEIELHTDTHLGSDKFYMGTTVTTDLAAIGYDSTAGYLIIYGGPGFSAGVPTTTSTPKGAIVLGGYSSTEAVAGAEGVAQGGAGGDSAGGAVGGAGGRGRLEGGDGGDSHTATYAAGAGGAIWIEAGAAGANLGGGGANGGDVTITAGDGTGSGTAGTIDIGTENSAGNRGTSAINLGNATDNTTITQTGSGQVTFSGNVDATAGLDVTGADLTVNGASAFAVTENTGNTHDVIKMRRADGTLRYVYINNSDQLVVSTTLPA